MKSRVRAPLWALVMMASATSDATAASDTATALRNVTIVDATLSVAWVTLAMASLGMSWWTFGHCRGLKLEVL